MTEPGRPSGLTKEVIAKIGTFIQGGSTQADACILAGIASSTFYNWMKQAREENENRLANDGSLFLELMDTVKRAESFFKATHLQNINNAGKRNWQASAWMLERKYPKEYAKIDRVSANQEDDNGILDELIAEMQKLQAGEIDFTGGETDLTGNDSIGEADPDGT